MGWEAGKRKAEAVGRAMKARQKACVSEKEGGTEGEREVR